MAIGIGSSVSTPASSHLLARYSPPKYAPLIFSVKQTGVPDSRNRRTHSMQASVAGRQ